MNINPISATDFYKTGHKDQYPDNTTTVYSNATCRTDKHFKGLEDFDHKVVVFGLQGICKWMLIDFWNEKFFSQPKEKVVGRYKRTLQKSLNVKDFDVSHMEALHDLGYLPIVIKAIPEGNRLNIKVPSYTIKETLPEFSWLVNYLETPLQSESWKVKIAATTAYEFKRMFLKFAEETGVDPAFVDFQGHDFSMRGMSGIWDATQCGAGHLLSFKGTDTIPAIEFLEDYYDAMDTFVGGSVPATEHAVMCMGQEQGEKETVSRLINKVYPSGIVSIVSDTWDFWNLISKTTLELKDDIMKRDGKVVFRPDSGDPVDIICGTAITITKKDIDKAGFDGDCKNYVKLAKYYAEEEDIKTFIFEGIYYKAVEPTAQSRNWTYEKVEATPEMKGAVECLWDIFGGTTTDKGFKTLDSHVGLIYGDSINLDRAFRILTALKAKGFSSANIVFGIGSFTYQFVTRDTFGEAVKATYGVVNGEAREIFKNPKTDDGQKKSAKGLIRVERENGNYVLYDQQTWEQEAQGELKELFRDSKMMREDDLDTIRARLHASL